MFGFALHSRGTFFTLYDFAAFQAATGMPAFMSLQLTGLTPAGITPIPAVINVTRDRL
jgi:hypothetical protein